MYKPFKRIRLRFVELDMNQREARPAVWHPGRNLDRPHDRETSVAR